MKVFVRVVFSQDHPALLFSSSIDRYECLDREYFRDYSPLYSSTFTNSAWIWMYVLIDVEDEDLLALTLKLRHKHEIIQYDKEKHEDYVQSDMSLYHSELSRGLMVQA